MRRLGKMSVNHEQRSKAVLRTTGDSFGSREARKQAPRSGSDTDYDGGTGET